MKKFGMRDFWNWVREADCQYTVFAVNSPIDKVSQAIANIYKRKQILEDVLSAQYTDSPKIMCQSIPVISVRNTPWTIVYLIPARTPQADYALRVSKKLKTRMITFSGEPDSEYMSYTVVNNGEIREYIQFVGFGEHAPVIFHSEIRSMPEFGWGDVNNFDYNQQIFQEFVNAFCQEEELYVPVCYKYLLPRTDLKRSPPVILRVAKCSKGKIEKANLVGDEFFV
ncbi:hypothetical protein K9N68_12240 [Kovacikia minuta CCNUW1]|uniref:hypothetical protein n=1 Tax=Kovacikia minuta TaxID=2931930 RepID=UPI001CCE8728|nr:hypothetical protein [Kovacikia minuta]UBF28571.1 hypothetical protein K9N68_12240 [Kovacikia minuta CCNUW1]